MKEIFKSVALVTEIGLILVICIGGGLLLGIFLDKRLPKTAPIFTIVLLLLGVGSGFWAVYRMVFPRGEV